MGSRPPLAAVVEALLHAGVSLDPSDAIPPGTEEGLDAEGGQPGAAAASSSTSGENQQRQKPQQQQRRSDLSALCLPMWLRFLHDVLLLRATCRLGDPAAGALLRLKSEPLFSSFAPHTSASLRCRKFCWDSLLSLGYPGTSQLLPALLSCGVGTSDRGDGGAGEAVAAIAWAIGTAPESRWVGGTQHDAATPASAAPPPKPFAVLPRAVCGGSGIRLTSTLSDSLVSAVRRIYLTANQLAGMEAAQARQAVRLGELIEACVTQSPAEPHAAAAAAVAAMLAHRREERARGKKKNGKSPHQTQGAAGETAAPHATTAHHREDLGRAVLQLQVLMPRLPGAVEGGGGGGGSGVADAAAALAAIDSALCTLERPAVLFSIKRAWREYKASLSPERFQALRPVLVARRKQLSETLHRRSWFAHISQLQQRCQEGGRDSEEVAAVAPQPRCHAEVGNPPHMLPPPVLQSDDAVLQRLLALKDALPPQFDIKL